MRSLDMHSLACLDALVAEAHVSRAAHRMGMGQPAMSEMLARLREIFKDPLLVRTGAGMVPTVRALEVARDARDALNLIERAVSGKNQLSPRDAALDLRIVAHQAVIFSVVPRLINRLQHEAPNVRVLAQPADVRHARDILDRNECDLVIGYPPAVPLNLHASMLFRLPLCCIVRKNHPEISGQIDLEQYVRYRHVVLGAGPNPVSTVETAIDKHLARRHLKRDIGVRVSDVLLSPAIVAETDFLATLSEPLASMFAAPLKLQKLRLPIPVLDVSIVMLWHERTHRDPIYRWLRRLIRSLTRRT